MPSSACVSVIIPTFNRAGFLRESLTSVLAQTRPPLEVIVVDDGSSDETPAVVQGFGRDVVYVRKDNGGKAAAINLALPRARGDYLWFFDDDDVALPDSIERRLGVLLARPELGWIFSAYYFGVTGPNGEIVRGARKWLTVSSSRAVWVRLLMECFFPLQGCLVRRECFAEIGNFDESLWRSQDYDMLIRLAYRFKGTGIDEPTFILRLHDDLRGPLAERHAVGSRRRIWSQYDRRIGRRIRQRFGLIDFMESPRDASTATAVDPRLALIRRAAVMASKGLIPEMISDCVEASRIQTAPLRRPERLLCGRMLRFPYFWFAYGRDAPAFWHGVRSLNDTKVGREILMIHCASLMRQAKSHDTPWTRRARYVSMALRILAECALRGGGEGG